VFGILKERLRQGHRTMAFPDAPPALPERFRGLPAVSGPCPTACGACLQACPADALARSEDGIRLDLGACTFCGDCAGICPEHAISFGSDWRMASRSRKGLEISQDHALELAQALESRAQAVFGRSLQIREVSAGGCGACEADVNVLSTIGWDLSRLGIQMVASPRHADALLVTGPVPRSMALALSKTWAAMPSPKFVIAVGSCAVSGGVFAGSPEGCLGVAAHLPVDLFIPGCPPHPATILDGILRLLGRSVAEPSR
jgi:Ni,Fe-hydrogenase III small subunit/ferredoxin